MINFQNIDTQLAQLTEARINNRLGQLETDFIEERTRAELLVAAAAEANREVEMLQVALRDKQKTIEEQRAVILELQDHLGMRKTPHHRKPK